MHKTKITYIINDLYIGGAERVLYDITSSLDMRLYDITIISLVPLSQYSERRTFYQLFLEKNIRVVHIAGCTGLTIRSFFSLTVFLLKNRPDILHCHLSVSIILGSLSGFFSGISSIIAHEHNTPNFYSKNIRIAYKIIRPIVSLTICYAETVEKEIFGSSNLLSVPPDKIRWASCTIINGVNLNTIDDIGKQDRYKIRNSLGVKNDDIVLFSSARLVDWKGHENLIRAMSFVKNERIKLYIAGDGPQHFFLRDIISTLNIKHKVCMLGLRLDVLELLHAADIFSLALVYPKDFYSEGIGMAALEAMASKLPCILAGYPSLDTSIINKVNAYIVKPNNISSLTTAIEELGQDAGLCATIALQGRLYVEENCSLTKIIPIYERIYSLLS